MIAFLDGKVELIREHWLILNVNGVGYRVNVGAGIASRLLVGEKTSLYTYTHVREDALSLYGFLNIDELELFELLLTVSGIGPKAAMNILSVATPEKIKSSIVNQDPTLLYSVSGIGKKVAEKVVVELKNKVGATGSLFTSFAKESTEEVYEALLQLGFKSNEISQAIATLPSELNTTQEKIKYCLSVLNKK